MSCPGCGETIVCNRLWRCTQRPARRKDKNLVFIATQAQGAMAIPGICPKAGKFVICDQLTACQHFDGRRRKKEIA